MVFSSVMNWQCRRERFTVTEVLYEIDGNDSDFLGYEDNSTDEEGDDGSIGASDDEFWGRQVKIRQILMMCHSVQ